MRDRMRWAAGAAAVALGTVVAQAAPVPAGPPPHGLPPPVGRSYTVAELDHWQPRWPNPYLSFLPADAEPDWETWRAKLALEAQRRRALKTASCADPVVVAETEPDDRAGDNDQARFGEPLAGVGTGAGQVPCAVMTGHVRPPPVVLTPPVEEDGSFAHATHPIAPAARLFALDGVIGDGAWGSTGAGTGDFDFYALDLVAGARLEVAVLTPDPLADLDPIAAVYEADGSVIAWNDNAPLAGFLSNFDSWLEIEAPAAGTYYVVVGGSRLGAEWWETLPRNPNSPGSGRGAGSEGEYRVVIDVAVPDPQDVDFFTLELRAGDVIGATVLAGARSVSVYTEDGDELVAADERDLSAIYPGASPLPGGGLASVAWVVDADGRYGVGVSGVPFFDYGGYRAEIAIGRGPLDRSELAATQVLFLDFNGALLDPAIVGGPPGLALLSPLASFLPGWGLSADRLDPVIDGIVAVVERMLAEDLRRDGGNGDYDVSGLLGEFDIELRNSRDDPDPFGEPNVSRVVIGGRIDQLGLATVGIAQSVDPGDFAPEETAVVLLDLLSAPAPDPNSLNSIPRGVGVGIEELVVKVVGTIAAHEAGHLFADFHTERDEGPATVMDRGGSVPHVAGVGADEVFGTADDLELAFEHDSYEPLEAFTGVEHTGEAVAHALVAGGPRPELTTDPERLALAPAPPGERAAGSVRLANDGTSELQLDSAILTGDDAASCDLVLPPLPATLTAGQAATIEVGCTAAGLGELHAVLRVASDDPAAPVREVAVSAQGGVPAVSVAPTSHDFGTLVYGSGTSPTPLEVTVANAGPGALRIERVDLAGRHPGRFEIVGAQPPPVVAAGATVAVTVGFDPRGAIGVAEGVLRVTSNDPGRQWADVVLAGEALGPDIALDPDGWAYPPTTVGGAKVRSFMVANRGVLDLAVSTTATAGEDATEFTVDSGGAPFVVAPGAEHELRVSFRPTSLGDKEALLRISSDDPDDGVLEAELSGEGVVPEATVAPAVLAFGAVPVGGERSLSVGILSTGGAPLDGFGSLISGPDAAAFVIESGAGTFYLTPGNSWYIRVGFHPDREGPYAAVLEIETNDPASPITLVPLNGDGAVARVTLGKECVVRGSTVDCTLSVANPTTAVATGVLVVDELPPALEWVSDDCGGGAPSGQEWSWQVGTLAAGGGSSCALGLRVLAPVPDEVTNRAHARTDATPAGDVDAEVAVVVWLAGPPIPAAGWLALWVLMLATALTGVALIHRRR